MKPKDRNENAKHPDWKTPMELKGVKPEAYKSARKAPRAQQQKSDKS